LLEALPADTAALTQSFYYLLSGTVRELMYSLPEFCERGREKVGIYKALYDSVCVLRELMRPLAPAASRQPGPRRDDGVLCLTLRAKLRLVSNIHLFIVGFQVINTIRQRRMIKRSTRAWKNLHMTRDTRCFHSIGTKCTCATRRIIKKNERTIRYILFLESYSDRFIYCLLKKCARF